MKKLLFFAVIICALINGVQAQNVDATISPDKVKFWVGEGSNQAVMIISWCEPAKALAWGYRFNAEKLHLSTMLHDICAADSRLSYDGEGFVNEIRFVQGRDTLVIESRYVAPEEYVMVNYNGGYSDGVDSQYFANGDYVKFGGYSCADKDTMWVCTWTTPVEPVTVPFEYDQTVYDGIVGTEGCQAIFCQDPAIVGWATGCTVERGYQNMLNGGALVTYGTDADGVGAATTSTTEHVVSLGDGGSAVLTFEKPIQNKPGYDFAVFENSFSDTFLELAFVEVSSDGENFVRFPAVSNTQADTQATDRTPIDATKLHNLAGKYRVGYGTPFDLEELADNKLVDVNNITHIRLVDVVGSIDTKYATFDSRGHIVNDPFPTDSYSAGFDLSGVCVLDGWTPGQTSIAQYARPALAIYPNPCQSYVVVEAEAGEEVVLYNLQGAELLRQTANDSRMTISMGNLPSGIYFVRCAGQSAKIIKR